MNGKPLWFLGSVIGGWTALRVAMLWPDGSGLLPTQARAAEAASRPVAASPLPAMMAFARSTAPATARSRQRATRTAVAVDDRPRTTRIVGPRPATAGPGEPVAVDETPAAVGLPGMPARSGTSRWSASGWLIVRDGGSPGDLPSPLLGGSQAGVRVVYAIDRDRQTAVFARAAGPLRRGPAELALGGQWRPASRLPVTLYGEGRLLGDRLSPAVGAFGGGAAAVGRFRLEGYGQAGVISRDGVSGFGDGQVRLVRPLGRVEVGAGVWGAAQRGATRLDVGPSVALALPARPLNLRLTVDWRQRIAGAARPAAGPVLSLGADF